MDALVSRASILIVDDDAFNREGMRLYLTQRGFHVAEAGDETTALALAQQQRFDVAILDIAIPQWPHQRAHPAHSTGIRLARRLKQHDPHIGIVLFSAYEDRGREVLKLLEAGVRGLAYLLKGCPPNELLRAVELVKHGGTFLDAEIVNVRTVVRDWMAEWSEEERQLVEEVIRSLVTLTDREQQIVKLLVNSLTPEAIAVQLALSARTVENHITRIYAKLGLSDAPSHLRRANLLTKAWLLNWLTSGAVFRTDNAAND
jgi:DNA-binding NarL/FixJ family response regulator